jgi:IS30 family transposase
MANVLKVQEQDSIRHLAAAGWSIRRIARQLGLDRKTVRRYLRESGSATAESSVSKSPPYFDRRLRRTCGAKIPHFDRRLGLSSRGCRDTG